MSTGEEKHKIYFPNYFTSWMFVFLFKSDENQFWLFWNFDPNKTVQKIGSWNQKKVSNWQLLANNFKFRAKTPIGIASTNISHMVTPIMRFFKNLKVFQYRAQNPYREFEWSLLGDVSRMLYSLKYASNHRPLDLIPQTER